MADDFKLAHPVEYFKEFIKKGIRPDGRKLDQFRNVLYDQDCVRTSDGSSIVRLGNTIMTCGIKCELISKPKDTTVEKAVVANVQLTPLCSPKYRPGAPPVQAQTLSQSITDQFNSSLILDHVVLSKMASAEAKVVLYADVICVNDDGNLFDAAYLAVFLALSQVSLPVLTMDEETGELVSVERGTIKTNLLANSFYPSTFAICDKEVILADPTREEESVTDSLLTVVVNDGGDITLFNKHGGSEVTRDVLHKCLDMASERCIDMEKILNTKKT